MPKASIIIPTLGRSQSLKKCVESIENQTFKDYEIILITQEGELAKLRNEGAKKASGEYLIFIDDDVITDPEWLETIIKTFQDSRTVYGVSGLSIIPLEYRKNRDIFRFIFFKFLYDKIFCHGQEYLPGFVTRAGAWTTGASNPNCNYEGEVMFLEACNMAFRKDAFERCRGFDESFRGVGDWSEPDLCYRIRKLGGILRFTHKARLYHLPSKSGAFSKRKREAKTRLSNYLLFSRRWVKPCFIHSLYKLFLRIYYAIKTT